MKVKNATAVAASVAVVTEEEDIELAQCVQAQSVRTAETSLVVEGATLEEASSEEEILGRRGRRIFINDAHEATGDSDAKWVGMLFCAIIIVIVFCSEPWDDSRAR